MKSACGVLAAATVTALILTPGVASAATTGSDAITQFDSGSGSGPQNTTVTFTVTSGALSMTAPTNANLGSGAPGSTISGALGQVTVTDNRALLSASWIAVASAGNWTTGGATSSETIPVGDVSYNPGSITTTGTITATGTPITLSGTPTAVVNGTAGVGNNTATWNPTIAAAVPASAVGGAYSGTLTQSVA